MNNVQTAAGRDRSSLLWALQLSARTWLTILGILSCGFTCSAVAEGPEAKNVLVLFSSFERNNTYMLNVIEPALRARVTGQITFYNAYLEYSRIADESYRKSQAETFQRTYSALKLDLVIISNPEALYFAVQYRDRMFPRVPIVFLGLSTRWLEGQSLWPGVTGLTVPVGLPETIELALHLHPDAKALAVVTNVSEEENYWLALAHSELLRRKDRVKEIDIVGPAGPELLGRIAALPPHTVVLFQLAPQASQQPVLGTWDILAAIAQRMPTYSAWPTLCLNYGCIGGAYPDAKKEFLSTAEIAAKVLSGTQPEDIPVAHDTDLQITVDSRQLQRWHIKESALPPGSVILNREPTLWERGRRYFLAGVAVILLQALLIFGLLWQRARKRKAEAVLAESEQRFRTVADTAPVLIWMSGDDKLCTYFNEPWLEFTGRPLAAELGNGWAEGVHPEDLQSCLATYTQSFDRRELFRMEYRLRRYDGDYRWIFDIGVPRFNPDGSFAGYIGSAIDITVQKLARQAIDSVSGQLIEAQEKERSRIARELHDDICQRLAVLSMEIQRTNRHLDASAAPAKDQLERIRLECAAIAGDVQVLSHELHSSKLDYLGIGTALRGFCKEFAKQNELTIEFTEQNVPKHLPMDVSLCLFRVAQEALHNALKHCGTTRYWVNLTGTSTEVQLEVRDEGAGFDLEQAKLDRGLGLVSMQERMHLAGGQFKIESLRGAGTRIVGTVPRAPVSDVDSEGTRHDATTPVAGAA